MCKKYIALRALIVQLKVRDLTKRISQWFFFVSLQVQYESTKAYPIVPRYTLLKDMIKTVLRDSAFAEVCHEIDDWTSHERIKWNANNSLPFCDNHFTLDKRFSCNEHAAILIPTHKFSTAAIALDRFYSNRYHDLFPNEQHKGVQNAFDQHGASAQHGEGARHW